MSFRNAFLWALGPTDLAALTPDLEATILGRGQILCEVGEGPDNVYFPSESVLSSVAVLSDGRTLETSSLGFEGVGGLLSAMTEIPLETRMSVQIGGGAMTLPAAKLRGRAAESPDLMRLVLKHAQYNAGQAEQRVACIGTHILSQRLARSLLISQDRVASAIMLLTQDYIEVMAGALRSSVDSVVKGFEEAGLITYAHGRLEILDRPGLERRACECYALDRASRELLFLRS